MSDARRGAVLYWPGVRVTSTLTLCAAAFMAAAACVDFEALLADCVARGACTGAPPAADAGPCDAGCTGCSQTLSTAGFGQVTGARQQTGCHACEEHDCGAYSCAPEGQRCATTCRSTADCVEGHWCNQGRCEARLALDEACTRDEQCVSRRCAERGSAANDVGMRWCSECAGHGDCSPGAPRCDGATGRCRALFDCGDRSALGVCEDAGFGACVMGACQCGAASSCGSDRAPSCTASSCACGDGKPCPLGQGCTDAGVCRLISGQPCVEAQQCRSGQCDEKGECR